MIRHSIESGATEAPSKTMYDTALTALEFMTEELTHWSRCSSCSKLSANGETHRAARLA